MSRLHKALNESFWLVDVKKDFELGGWTFHLKAGKLYKQEIGSNTLNCSCKDFQLRQLPCKNILYLFTRLVDFDNPPEDWSPAIFSFYDELWIQMFIDIPENRETLDCPICFEKFTPVDVVVGCRFSCRQIFHHKCLEMWLSRAKSCPMCRLNM